MTKRSPVPRGVPEEPRADSGARALLELRLGECRWPEGEGPFSFCGAPAITDKPYCPHHHGIAYRPGEAAESEAA